MSIRSENSKEVLVENLLDIGFAVTPLHEFTCDDGEVSVIGHLRWCHADPIEIRSDPSMIDTDGFCYAVQVNDENAQGWTDRAVFLTKKRCDSSVSQETVAYLGGPGENFFPAVDFVDNIMVSINYYCIKVQLPVVDLSENEGNEEIQSGGGEQKTSRQMLLCQLRNQVS